MSPAGKISAGIQLFVSFFSGEYVSALHLYLKHTYTQIYLYIQECISNIVALLHWRDKNYFDQYCTDVGSCPSVRVQKAKPANELPDSEPCLLFPPRSKPL